MKKISILAAALLTALSSAAVTLPFNAPAPPSWSKVAICTARDGVNVRKTPSTTAPKMVFNENKVTDYETPAIYYGYWGTRTGGAIQPVLFQGMSVAPVVSEKPGWVELLNEGPKRQSNGWVSTKFCKVVDITPIRDSGNPSGLDFMLLDTPADMEGTYGIYMTTDDLNSEANFYIGRLVDGKMVCPYMYTCDYFSNEYGDGSDAPTTLTKEEYRYMLRLTRQCMTQMQNEYGENYYPDINKLPASMIKFIVREAKPIDGILPVIYLADGKYNLFWE